MISAGNILEFCNKNIQAGVRWASANVGARWWGVSATLYDAVLQAAVFATSNRLPNHPDCAPDARDQIGKDRQLFRFSGETDSNWAARIQNAWTRYEQGGARDTLLREIISWGQAAYPATWLPSPPLVELIEDYDAGSFTVQFPYGTLPWGYASTYDSGVSYDAGYLYDITGVTSSELFQLKALIRKWKPARCKAFIRVILASGVAFYDGGAQYDDGSLYANPTDILTFQV